MVEDDYEGTRTVTLEEEERRFFIVCKTDYSKVILGEDGPHQMRPKKFYHKLNDSYNKRSCL